MELPINEDNNSARILETGEYQLPKSKGKEDIWLIRYLMADGDSGYEDIYTIWHKIAVNRYQDLGEEEMRALFWKFWKRAKNRKKNYNIFEFEVFDEEIKEIDSKKIVPWYKEYALLLLAYYKITGREKCDLKDIPSTSLFKLVTGGAPRSRDKIRVRAALEEQGLISIDRNFALVLNYQKRNGISIGIFSQIKDVASLYGLFKNEMVCPVCGKKFQYNSKTKRSICLSCWKQKEAERSAENRKYKEKAKFLLNEKEK